MANRKPWTDLEVDLLRALYPGHATARLALMFDRPQRSVYHKAYQLGLKKSEAFLASPEAGRIQAGSRIGETGRFKPGITPWNKGRKGVCYEGMKATQFQPGSLPVNYQPIGTERMRSGYLCRKVTDTGYPPRDWVPVHILLWRVQHGPVPEGHIVVFRDSNPRHIAIDNLECISRSDLMRRNTVHNLPGPLKQVIRLKGALKRVIRNKEKQNEQHN